MSLLDLDQFRPDAEASPAARKSKPAWAPPTLGHFRPGMLLCFDQSLSATGFVVLSREVGRITIHESRTLRTRRPDSDESKEGPAEWLLRAKTLRSLMYDALYPFSIAPQSGWAVVNEAPPTGGNKLDRPESSLMAATVLHMVVADLGLPMLPMVGVYTHKRLTCGVHNAKKKDHHAVLNTYCPNLVHGWSKVTNPDERDSASVGLAALLRPEEY